jgi:hypothetical protein
VWWGGVLKVSNPTVVLIYGIICYQAMVVEGHSTEAVNNMDWLEVKPWIPHGEYVIY